MTLEVKWIAFSLARFHFLHLNCMTRAVILIEWRTGIIDVIKSSGWLDLMYPALYHLKSL